MRERISRRWSEPFLAPVALLAASICAHLLVAWTQIRITPGLTVVRTLTKWDGGYYLKIAQFGYPDHVTGASSLGFYPLYPMIVRAVVDVTSCSYDVAGLFVAIASSTGAVLVLWRLTERLCGSEVASRGVALFVFAPGAIVLSMTYSEPLFILLAAGCLLLLLEKRWEFAGALAFLACLARPNGFAVVAACATAAFVAVRADRKLRACVAPALAFAGFVALPVYDKIHTGDFLAYWKTQHRGWSQSFDFGWNTLRKTAETATHPFHDFNLFMSFVCLIVILVGLMLLLRWRPPAPITAYTVVILVLALGSSQLVSTFRFALTAFPLTIAYARIARGTKLGVVLAVSAIFFAMASAAATTVLYTP